ncbi:MAG TPA: AAA family ATPase [Myxococcota bacterium]|nr:AAA family ATPase [Myxococcota bacterium]
MANGRDQARALPRDEGYTYVELKELVGHTLGAGVSVLVRGHPGVGKSTLAADVAAGMGLPLVDIRLAQRDPAELAGVYFPDRDRRELALFPPDWVKQACETPVMVFLDEINAAVTRLHQAAAYQIVLEKRVGPFAFHPGTVVMAAGNLEEDNAIVSSLSSALCNRFAHYVLRVDSRAWLEWGSDAGIDESILAYIGRHGEEALYENTGDHAFATPRSWEMASRLMAGAPVEIQKRLIAACVGLGAAEKFGNYQRIYQKVNAKKIIEKGLPMDFRSGREAEPSFIYAAVFAVAAWLNSSDTIADEHLPNVVTFARSPGLDPEYVFLFLRQIKRHPNLLDRLKTLPEYQALAADLVALHMGLYQ